MTTPPLQWRDFSLGQLISREARVDLLEKGLARNPTSSTLRIDLAAALLDAGNATRTVQVLKSDPGLTEGSGRAAYVFAQALLIEGNVAEAERSLWLAVDNGYRGAAGLMAEMLFARGQVDRAKDILIAQFEANGSDASTFLRLARFLLSAGGKDELWRLSSRSINLGSDNAYVPSALAHSAMTREQMALVQLMFDYDGLLETSIISFDEEEELALRDELCASKARSDLPMSKATSGGGWRIDNLQALRSERLQQVIATIQTRTNEYVAKCSDRLAQHCSGSLPVNVKLNAWAICTSMDGYERWHVHPAAWLSGVLYLQTPIWQYDMAAKAGAIEFDAYPLSPTGVSCQINTCLMPKSSQLLLFPSYFAHRTWPTAVASDRLCIAFDVMPD